MATIELHFLEIAKKSTFSRAILKTYGASANNLIDEKHGHF
jgi:hypothetical protein